MSATVLTGPGTLPSGRLPQIGLLYLAMIDKQLCVPITKLGTLMNQASDDTVNIIDDNNYSAWA